MSTHSASEAFLLTRSLVDFVAIKDGRQHLDLTDLGRWDLEQIPVKQNHIRMLADFDRSGDILMHHGHRAIDSQYLEPRFEVDTFA